MKNVNLTGLFLAMVAKFSVNSFDLHSVVPEGGEPIDALITFKGGNVGVFDLGKVLELVKENLTDAIKESGVKIKEGNVQVYIEFANSTFIDELS